MQAQQTIVASLPMTDFAKTATLIALEVAASKVIMRAVVDEEVAAGEAAEAIVTTDILVGFQSMLAPLNT